MDTQSPFRIDWTVDAEEGVPEGTPVVRLDAEDPLKLERRRGRQLLPILKRGERVSTEAFDLTYVDKPDVDRKGGATVTLHGLYRGQRFDADALKIPVNPPPDITAYRFPLRGNALAVRAEPEALKGRLAIVLDASPSMGVRGVEKKDWTRDYKCKYHFATEALRQSLKNLPPGTEVSVWTFGDGLEHGERGPTRIEHPIDRTPWDRKNGRLATDLENLDDFMPGTLKDKDGEALGLSPIAKAMVRAMETDLKGKDDIKTLLVLTDGKDNENADLPTSVPKYLEEKFKNKNIVIKFVLFTVTAADRQEVDEAAKQFKCIDSFEPAGQFYHVEADLNPAKIAELQKDLADAMTPKFRLSKDGKSLRARGAVSPGFPISLSEDRRLRWVGDDGRLSPGDYELGAYGLDPRLVQLKEGDRLLVKLSRDARGLLTLQRAVQPKNASNGDSPEVDDWTHEVVQNDYRYNGTADELRQLLVLERPTDPVSGRGTPIRQLWPSFCWLEEAVLRGGQEKPAPLVWYLDYRYDAPTYVVRSRDWPKEASSKLTAWWTDSDRPLTDSKVLQLQMSPDNGEVTSRDGPGKNDFFAWGKRQNRRVKVEPPDDGGAYKEETRDSLVLTVQLPKSGPRVRAVPDPFAGGEEHYYFDELGYYQAVFWGWDTGKPFHVHLVSLDAFKNALGVKRYTTSLEAPSRHTALPPTLEKVVPRTGNAPP
jgi:hypothetical protein